MAPKSESCELDANSLKAATGMEGRKAGLLGVDWSRSAVKHGLASKLGWARGVSRGVNSRHLLVPQKGLGARPLPLPGPCPAPARAGPALLLSELADLRINNSVEFARKLCHTSPSPKHSVASDGCGD